MNPRSIIPIALLAAALPAALTACNASSTAVPEATVPPEATAPPVAEATEAGPPATPTAIHWTYEGEEGPEHWGELSADYAACADGKAQSPIDIAQPGPEDLANIVFNYEPSKVNILNNGHTIQVNYDPGSFVEIDGMRYDLAQFHFHAPSEHSIGGQLAQAELHLVHKSAAGDLAVVGVLIEEGAENPAFATIWANLPAEPAEVKSVDAEVDAAELLPAEQATYRYDGSLTTPPCSEGVKWNVMTTPIQMSAAQLAAFTAIVDGNNRPVQALGERKLVEDTSP